MRPEQPIPATMTTSSLDRFRLCTLRISEPRTMPCPQPGQNTCGNFLLCRRYSWMSWVTSDMLHLYYGFKYFLRGNDLAVDTVDCLYPRAAAVNPFYLAGHLAHVHFGHDN